MDGAHGQRQPLSPAISASAVVPHQRQMQLHQHPARPAIADLFTLYLGVRAPPFPNPSPSACATATSDPWCVPLQMNSKQRAEDPAKETS
jgi:mediator of RNA polymerase II transcription subunit 23